MTMRVIRGLHNIRVQDQQVAVTIGNFDGMHLGHQSLLAQLRRVASGLRCCVICFEPQPLEYLRPKLAPLRLQTLNEKLRFLSEQGVEQVLVLRFDQSLAALSASDFVQQVLIEGLQTKHLVVGDDYRFGYQRSGDVALLKEMSGPGGFVVAQLDTFVHEAARVSSTRIRLALQAGDLDEARTCLGRPYRLRGRVIHGQKLGRTLGAPTANIALSGPSPMRHGVYCVRLDGEPGVANIGLRPTIGGAAEHLEVHVLSGHPELYDKMLVVEFEKFLRPEHKFADLTQLKTAIAEDVSLAKRYFDQDAV